MPCPPSSRSTLRVDLDRARGRRRSPRPTRRCGRRRGPSDGVRNAWPHAPVTTLPPDAPSIARSNAKARSSGDAGGQRGGATRRRRRRVVVADALDDDLVGLDRHLDLAVPGPVLGVDAVVGDRRVEPQAVALVAVLEGALVRGRLPGAGATAATATATAALGRVAVLVVVGVTVGLGGLGLLGLAGGLGLELGGDQRVVLGAQVDLVVEVGAGGLRSLTVGEQIVLLLEGFDLLDGDLQLVSDPRVGATLAHPGADLVQMRTERSSGHAKGVILVESPGGTSGRCVTLQSDARPPAFHFAQAFGARHALLRRSRKLSVSPRLHVGNGPARLERPVAGTLGGVQPCSY